MNIQELKREAIVNQMSYYVAIYAHEADVNESVIYYHDDNICGFGEPDTYNKEKLFSIPLVDLLSTGALCIKDDYLDVKDYKKLKQEIEYQYSGDN